MTVCHFLCDLQHRESSRRERTYHNQISKFAFSFSFNLSHGQFTCFLHYVDISATTYDVPRRTIHYYIFDYYSILMF